MKLIYFCKRQIDLTEKNERKEKQQNYILPFNFFEEAVGQETQSALQFLMLVSTLRYSVNLQLSIDNILGNTFNLF